MSAGLPYDGLTNTYLCCLAVEGEPTSDGRLILPEALTWDQHIPIRSPFDEDGNSRLLGLIDGIKRDGKLIRGIARLLDPPEEIGVSAAMDSVVVNERVSEAEPTVFAGGRIRGVLLVPVNALVWPDTVLVLP